MTDAAAAVRHAAEALRVALMGDLLHLEQAPEVHYVLAQSLPPLDSTALAGAAFWDVALQLVFQASELSASFLGYLGDRAQFRQARAARGQGAAGGDAGGDGEDHEEQRVAALEAEAALIGRVTLPAFVELAAAAAGLACAQWTALQAESVDEAVRQGKLEEVAAFVQAHFFAEQCLRCLGYFAVPTDEAHYPEEAVLPVVDLLLAVVCGEYASEDGVPHPFGSPQARTSVEDSLRFMTEHVELRDETRALCCERVRAMMAVPLPEELVFVELESMTQCDTDVFSPASTLLTLAACCLSGLRSKHSTLQVLLGDLPAAEAGFRPEVADLFITMREAHPVRVVAVVAQLSEPEQLSQFGDSLLELLQRPSSSRTDTILARCAVVDRLSEVKDPQSETRMGPVHAQVLRWSVATLDEWSDLTDFELEFLLRTLILTLSHLAFHDITNAVAERTVENIVQVCENRAQGGDLVSQRVARHSCDIVCILCSSVVLELVEPRMQLSTSALLHPVGAVSLQLRRLTPEEPAPAFAFHAAALPDILSTLSMGSFVVDTMILRLRALLYLLGLDISTELDAAMALWKDLTSRANALTEVERDSQLNLLSYFDTIVWTWGCDPPRNYGDLVDAVWTPLSTLLGSIERFEPNLAEEINLRSFADVFGAPRVRVLIDEGEGAFYGLDAIDDGDLVETSLRRLSGFPSSIRVHLDWKDQGVGLVELVGAGRQSASEDGPRAAGHEDDGSEDGDVPHLVVEAVSDSDEDTSDGEDATLMSCVPAQFQLEWSDEDDDDEEEEEDDDDEEEEEEEEDAEDDEEAEEAEQDDDDAAGGEGDEEDSDSDFVTDSECDSDDDYVEMPSGMESYVGETVGLLHSIICSVGPSLRPRIMEVLPTLRRLLECQSDVVQIATAYFYSDLAYLFKPQKDMWCVSERPCAPHADDDTFVQQVVVPLVSSVLGDVDEEVGTARLSSLVIALMLYGPGVLRTKHIYTTLLRMAHDCFCTALSPVLVDEDADAAKFEEIPENRLQLARISCRLISSVARVGGAERMKQFAARTCRPLLVMASRSTVPASNKWKGMYSSIFLGLAEVAAVAPDEVHLDLNAPRWISGCLQRLEKEEAVHALGLLFQHVRRDAVVDELLPRSVDAVLGFAAARESAKAVRAQFELQLAAGCMGRMLSNPAVHLAPPEHALLWLLQQLPIRGHRRENRAAWLPALALCEHPEALRASGSVAVALLGALSRAAPVADELHMEDALKTARQGVKSVLGEHLEQLDAVAWGKFLRADSAASGGGKKQSKKKKKKRKKKKGKKSKGSSPKKGS